MDQDKTFLGTEPVGKLLLKLAVPTVIAQLVNMLYNIVDRIYIGHMPGDGSLALTGIGVCMPIILVVSAFASFSATGGAPRASIFMGRGDHDSAEKTLGGCFTLQLGISAVLTAALLILLRRQLDVQMVLFFWESQACLLSAALPQTFRPQAALGTGDAPSKRVCHTNAMLAPAPPTAALAVPRRRRGVF